MLQLDYLLYTGDDRKLLSPTINGSRYLQTATAGMFPSVIVKRYDSCDFEFSLHITGDTKLKSSATLVNPREMRAADGAYLYLFDYCFGFDNADAHEGDLYLDGPVRTGQYDGTGGVAPPSGSFDLAIYFFGYILPRKTYCWNIQCGIGIETNPDYNPAHPEVYTYYEEWCGNDHYVPIHWLGHFKRQADWNVYFDGTYAGKWSPQYSSRQNVEQYLAGGGAIDDLIPPRIRETDSN